MSLIDSAREFLYRKMFAKAFRSGLGYATAAAAAFVLTPDVTAALPGFLPTELAGVPVDAVVKAVLGALLSAKMTAARNYLKQKYPDGLGRWL